MYAKQILLENVGPIRNLQYDFPFDEKGNPKPLVLVGQNGSGKSIFLSYIVNSLLSAQQQIYDNPEVMTGKAYKFQSPAYISPGKNYYFGKVSIENGVECFEWQLSMQRKDFETQHGIPGHESEWKQIPEMSTSVLKFKPEGHTKELETLFNKNCVLYFPPNRFEEPAWLNFDNLNLRAEFSDLKHITRISNRSIVQYSPLEKNRNWLLDVVFDSRLYEMQVVPVPVQIAGTTTVKLNHFVGFDGISAQIDRAVNQILRLIMRRSDALKFAIGPRSQRNLSLNENNQRLIQNIFQLSTGETSVLNLFLSILRDFDLSGAQFESLEKVRGIVLVDEIDSHLHCELQSKILPAIIKRFPCVQFIVTSHSPLFLLGLNRELSPNGFTILSLPDGKEIGVERFVEFEHAYEVLKETNRHEDELASAIDRAKQPVVVFEGDYDVKYIRKAATLIGKEELLRKLELWDAEGFGGLGKIWKQFDSKLSAMLPRSVLLLFDCDIAATGGDKDRIAKRVIPSVPSNPIAKGIENLFPRDSIDRAKAANPKFIDITPEVKRLVRGEEEVIPEKLEVNHQEKRNFCDWFCQYGTVDDFAGFKVVFDIIESTLKL